MSKTKTLLAALAAFSALSPADSFACACGCGIFDVGTNNMLPTEEGGYAFISYAFANQNKNWHGNKRAPDDDNEDKDIKTSFVTVGAQYMFNRQWGAQFSVPVERRHFTTTDEGTGDIVKFNHAGVGDIRVKGIYSGFSDDMSTGVTFGFRLPSGNTTQDGFDRDTAIGTGSTDVLLGAYHVGNLAPQFDWFTNAELDQPVLIRNGYRPGSEVNASVGTYYKGLHIGKVQVSPVAQVIGSAKLRDRGINAGRDETGYTRMLLSPGVEIDTGTLRIYGDVSFPVYEHVRGDQLVADQLFKINISHSF